MPCRISYKFTPARLNVMAGEIITETSAIVDFVLDMAMDEKYKIPSNLIYGMDGLLWLEAFFTSIDTNNIDITRGDHYKLIEVLDNFLLDNGNLLEKHSNDPVIASLHKYIKRALKDLVDIVDHFYVIPPN